MSITCCSKASTRAKVARPTSATHSPKTCDARLAVASGSSCPKMTTSTCELHMMPTLVSDEWRQPVLLVVKRQTVG
jgi:hypothetical protein